MSRKRIWCAALALCILAAMLSGCRIDLSIGLGDLLTGEEYPDAAQYQAGAFTYRAEEITAVEVYWRSGAVTITESDEPELSVKESGGELSEEIAMHHYLDGSVLRIRFCKSGARVHVNAEDKRLSLAVPKQIELSVHTTSADIKADTLEQKSVLLSAHSGETELGAVTADEVDLSSSSGAIRADSVAAQTFRCSASSGELELGTVATGTLDCETSSGDVTVDSVTAGTAQVTTSSGSVELTLKEAPSVNIRTSSGGVDLTLAAGGAEIRHSAHSGKLRTSRPYDREGDRYVFGSGESKITVESSSGNLKIE